MNHSDGLEEVSHSFSERLLMLVCQFNFILYIALILESMLLLLAVLSFLFGNMNPETEIVLLLDFVLLAIAIIPTVGSLVVCHRR